MRFSRSTQLMCLPLEALMFSIRTGFHLSQMTLLRWLTFLLRSHAVTLRVLLFWIYFFLLMLVLVQPWLSLHWIILIMLSCFHLSQITLLRWLTFLLRSHTVTLRVLLFWIYFFLDASTCSTVAFPPLDNSDHVVLVSTDFPQQDAHSFHRIAFDYSRVDWDGLCDHFRDVP